mmetsp:Transcript_42962/g.96703  ORF Transcript_42962/g.96703 Transcript_42962/m.96703 type:complete len:99 (+) Transcript_42962:242-538(+)
MSCSPTIALRRSRTGCRANPTRSKTPRSWSFFNTALAVKSAEQETGKDNAFCVQRTKDGRYFYFVANSQQEKEEWIGAIGRLMVRRTVIMDPEEECGY